ncbi:hypothetical protein L596_012677 [Steinernema carpocapsae]|uniref:Uncharacterized protein n=1 Tax=Steinernema carpocapsae TaxID=34508 RepID=A0A4U5NXZ4_STECR|nr:hypothetical protein L596_012677 [Steinernema carpocapsae]
MCEKESVAFTVPREAESGLGSEKGLAHKDVTWMTPALLNPIFGYSNSSVSCRVQAKLSLKFIHYDS